jgi:hypothetical protein
MDPACGIKALKWYSGGIGAFVVCAIIIAILAKVAVLKMIWNMVPAWLKKHGLVGLEIAVLGFHIVGAIFDLAIVEDGREMIIKTMGNQKQTSNWGYGQIMAILIWFPVLWTMLNTIS